MRVNIYAEEMTDRIEIISKEIEGHAFTGLRIYLALPVSLPPNVWLAGPSPDVSGAYFEPPNDETRNVQGPFMHRPGDDDSAAVTFWGKKDLRHTLKKALEMLDAHYAAKGGGMRIIVNGETRDVTDATVNYLDVVGWIGEQPESVVSITYRRAIGGWGGELQRGGSIVVTDGTIIEAYITGNS